jgi:hypothetical protein
VGSIVSACGQPGRIVVARIGAGTDLIEGIEEICRRYDIKSGLILGLTGSLSGAKFTYIVPKEDSKLGAGKGVPYTLPGPLNILAAEGTIARTERGEYYVHIHAALADQLDHVYGGHIFKPTTVLLTMEVAIMETAGISLMRRFYDETGSEQLSPEEERD